MINRVAALWVLIGVLIANSLINAEILSEIDTKSYGCDIIRLKDAEESLKHLNQIRQQVETGQFDQAISEFQEFKELVRREIQVQVQKSFVVVQDYQYALLLRQKFNSIRNVEILEQLNSSQYNEIKSQIYQFIDTFQEQKKKTNSDVLLQNIENFLEDLAQIKKQYLNLEEISIEELISKIEIIRNNCNDEAITSQQIEGHNFMIDIEEENEIQNKFIEFPQVLQVEKKSLLNDQENQIKVFDQQQEIIENEPYEIVNRLCISGESSILDLSQSQREVVDLKVNDVKQMESQEYGYGFWIRWLTRWPEKQYKGISQPWYFISRLTKNDPYDNIGMGDRLLAIWLGQTGFTFVTNDILSENPNLIKQIPFGDIEGIWTYLHYSYKEGQAVGIMKLKEETQFVFLDAKHQQTNFLRLIIGGSDLNLYPSFNGQISSPIFKLGQGSFIKTDENFNLYVMACNHIPEPDCKDTNQIQQIIQGIKKLDSIQTEFYSDQKQQFPTIYGIGGWYKWVNIEKDSEYFLFRITINNQEQNDKLDQLGDRTLAVQLIDKQLYSFSTYSYQNMFGEGQSNIVQIIESKNKYQQWHYISFQYNRDIREAYGSIIFQDETMDLKFQNINHYLVPIFKILINKDQLKSGFEGYIADINFVTCQDLFNSQFHLKQTLQFPIHSTLQVQVSKLIPDQICQITDHTIVDSAFDDTQQLAEIEVSEDLIKQYGYSFWLRYLTRHPKPMYSGKNQPWYFVSRLTNNKEYYDTQKGDRLLGIWQGQGFYSFYTNDIITNNWNLNQEVEFHDIEGIWTYFSFSYCSYSQQAVGFVKYSDQEPQKLIFNVEHETIQYLKLIIGGSDLQIYPAINGQFTKANFMIGSGAFIDTLDKLNKFSLECNSQPQGFFDQYYEQTIIEDNLRFQDLQNPLPEFQSNPLVNFPVEYGVQGWFKWEPIRMEQWHLAFRLHINKDLTNKNDQLFGDRTLAAWVSPSQNGIYSFATYSYQNLNQQGETNIAKIISQNQQQAFWHFISFSYNRQTRVAEGYVQFQNKKELIRFDSINHYLVPQIYLNVGKDRFYNSWSGYIGKFNLNLGVGASKNILNEGNVPPIIKSLPKIYITETIETCLIDTTIVEVTQINLKSIIDTLQQNEYQEKICYCIQSTIQQIKG